jgi:2,3-bisphosphoglycerate-independent phosphoglycerate mutase
MSNQERNRNPVVLMVLDGWGWRTAADGNAIAMASTPNWDALVGGCPMTLLEASGLRVGLPEGQMGNSEVGHLNLGAGRVVPQDLVRINQSIASGEFRQLPPLVALADRVRQNGGTVHLVGLLGQGGVHAMGDHLVAALQAFAAMDVPRIAVHGFLDGRDSSPTAGAGTVAALQAEIDRLGGRACLASLIGRYFAMDRDRRWERTRLAWELMVHGAGAPAEDLAAAVSESYQRGVTDEFVQPIVAINTGQPAARIAEGDVIFYFNYRSDRMRQIVAALSIEGFSGFPVNDRPTTTAVTMTQYDQTFPIPQAFPPFSMARILAEELSAAGRSQFRTAETEKYPHVTYFFNGGLETPWAGEERELVASQKVATYDLAPEMSAPGIGDTLLSALRRRDHDFYLCNFANADMVGHTGVVPAVVRAVEAVDFQVGRIVEEVRRRGATLLITADHGNAEQMIDPATGGPHTAHTTNPVPIVAVGDGIPSLRAGGALCDVAPTVLSLMGLAQPSEMTGSSLIYRDTEA